MDYEYISESELEEMFEEFLDERYGQIKICGLKYYASIALYRVDETAYHCKFNSWINSESDRLAEIEEERRIAEEGEDEEAEE